MNDSNKIIVEENRNRLAIYMFLGGLAGAGITIWAIIDTFDFSSSLFIQELISAIFYIHSIYCAIILYKNNKHWYLHSMLNQSLQLFKFIFPGFIFQYVSGISFYLGINFAIMKIGISKIGFSSFALLFHSHIANKEIDLNIVAILFIYYISWIRKKERSLN